MKVAIVTESFLPSINGVTNSVLRVIDTLLAQGHEILVIAPTSEGPSYRGVPVIKSPAVVLSGFPVAIPTPFVSAALDRFEPDVIHVAAPFWLGGEAIAYGHRRGVPTVAIYQTDVAGYMKRYGLDFATSILDALTANIHKLATLTLAPTQDGVDRLKSLGIDNVDIWGRGVDLGLFSPTRRNTPVAQELRAKWAPQAERIVGYVGRLAPEKQVGRLIEVCGIPGTRIVIVGDGPDRQELEDRFTGYPVTFAGRLSGDDLANAYAAMDIFVHAGTEETFGQTIQEAHASGLPVVAPSIGGQRHLIRDGIDGYLVDHTRWGAFREKVHALVDDDVARRAMAREAYLAVADKSWENNNQALLGHYASVLATRTRALVAA
ncbi:MAG: glycosyltransferase family 1 protein [Pontimonas sp.]|nr:glycosyltransferase family 1 protein [Pontimonas sp.]